MTARFPYPNIPRRSYGSTSPYIVVRQPFTGECRREAVETLGLAMNAWIRPDITVLAQAFVVDAFGQAIVITRNSNVDGPTQDQFAMTEEAERVLEWVFPGEEAITEMSLAAIERDVLVYGWST